MDVSYPSEAESFRAEVRDVLAEELPPGWQGIGAIAAREDAERFTAQWRQTLYRRALLGITWPPEYGGRGLSRLHQVVLMEELARAGVPFGEHTDLFSIKMLGSTLLRWGTEEQRRRFLPRILAGEDRWCQGFSEPGAGSDLAALATRARVDGREWVIDGQKIWTSVAHRANWIFLLARTDPGARGHAGISFLLCPLDQPGIDIRPIRQLSGDSDFNEVFFTGARTPADMVVGEPGEGWKVAMTLLGHERGEEAATNPILFRAELDRLLMLAASRGKDHDPLIRQRLAWCYARVEIMRYLGYRILTQVQNGTELGAAASVSKLYWSEYHVAATGLALDIEGLDGLVPEGRGPLRTVRTDDPGAPNSSGSWLGAFLNARAGTIYAGTSEVQRNILAETVLGLPKERRQ
ncbi:MAG: acyl-CoA dehydrogenase family protein [Streptosporangiaceae bacterium]|nr:acyl-CoA dehydrogenase family protein [Streptosporangiaceae bacterium]MBV9855419.1 acyl-CoA dehydrogenase family protein [Streptosporangiaceae bacterium]